MLLGGNQCQPKITRFTGKKKGGKLVGGMGVEKRRLNAEGGGVGQEKGGKLFG